MSKFKVRKIWVSGLGCMQTYFRKCRLKPKGFLSDLILTISIKLFFNSIYLDTSITVVAMDNGILFQGKKPVYNAQNLNYKCQTGFGIVIQADSMLLELNVLEYVNLTKILNWVLNVKRIVNGIWLILPEVIFLEAFFFSEKWMWTFLTCFWEYFCGSDTLLGKLPKGQEKKFLLTHFKEKVWKVCKKVSRHIFSKSLFWKKLP